MSYLNEAQHPLRPSRPAFHPLLFILLLLLACLALMPFSASAIGTWTPLNNYPPGPISLTLVLTDGTVMAQSSYDSNWFRLTPDATGSYINGTWTTLAPMHSTRLYFASQVLNDGRVFVAGGEYGSTPNTAEVYNPLSNTWTLAPTNSAKFVDAASELLPNGNVLVAPVTPATYGGTLIWIAASNTWATGPTLYRGDDQDEASWVKLPDQSILTIDPSSQNSERYIPSLNKWINDGAVPTSMYSKGELGAAFLLPNGTAFFLGATNHTAYYQPTGKTNAGTWTAGPNIPNNLGAYDAPAAMMVNGKILCAVGSNASFTAPTYFYEFDYLSNTFTAVGSPDGNASFDEIPYVLNLLDLPDGTVLLSSYSYQLYVYTPDGSPLAAGKPTITSVVPNPDGSYHLTGMLFDGISEGAAYGDDWQMATDYPVARLTNSNGNVQYARTYNRSTNAVMTGTNLMTADITLPPGFTNGVYPLVVTANGIASDPYPLTIASTNSVTLVGSASGNQLQLSWPADHLGWRLLTQTNHLATGISALSGDWSSVANSALTNAMVMPIFPGKPASFYRLVYP